jgi:hypothetical protein
MEAKLMNVLTLSAWLNHVLSRAGGDILAVQTLRNALMAASVIASAALIALMGVLAASAHLPAARSLVLGLVLASCSGLALWAAVKLSKLGFSVQFNAANYAEMAESLFFALRLLQASAVLLTMSLLLAAVSLAI